MITREYSFTESTILSITELHPEIKTGVFFDIETTGFSANKNALYLIGCCWFENNQWRLIQWLASDTSVDEQTQIIEQFFKCISRFKTLISYNGHTFDLPFIEKKCSLLELNYDITAWNHIDLYMVFRPLKHLLKLDNLKLKSIERFLGIFRDDLYSGGALIPVYETYTKTGAQQLLELLLLHNYEDIKDMLFVLPLYAYINLTEGQFNIISTNLFTNEHILQVKILPKMPLPKDFCYDYLIPINDCYNDINLNLNIIARENCVTLNIPMYNGVLKYFYDNPKDYYYLPLEDYAIHKSIATYVDKGYKKKATLQNCYTKKEGTYLPQKNKMYSPSFKFNYKDIIEWFLYDGSLEHSEQFKNYIQSLLKMFL